MVAGDCGRRRRPVFQMDDADCIECFAFDPSLETSHRHLGCGRAVRGGIPRTKPGERPGAAGETPEPETDRRFAVVFVEGEMTCGNQIFLAVEIRVPLEAERLHRLHMLFSAPAVHFRLPRGGTAILNLKNLVRVTFNPGPDVTPIDAWPARHLSRRQGSGRIADVMTGTNPNL